MLRGEAGFEKPRVPMPGKDETTDGWTWASHCFQSIFKVELEGYGVDIVLVFIGRGPPAFCHLVSRRWQQE